MAGKTQENDVKIIPSESYNLYGSHFPDGILGALNVNVKASEDNQGQKTNTLKDGIVKYPQPVASDSIYALKDISGHHCTCIQAKKYATVGLGFVDDAKELSKATGDDAIQKAASLLSGQGHVESETDKHLDQLCTFGFYNELLDVAEDFMDTGTGYMEVHRNASGDIDGITQIPYKDIWACTYRGRLFYQYTKPEGITSYWVPFGKANKKWIASSEGPFDGKYKKEEEISEIIPFIMPSNRVKFYGYPDWLSASVDIDLLKKSKQYKADFYHNRGVLDKVLVVTGETVDTTAWDRIVASLKGVIGGGRNFGSMALNLKNEQAKVTIENMGVDGNTEDQFAKDNETLTQNIVSSHSMPPILANILIPGKLGASNEFIHSLTSFQLLKISAYQNIFEKTLGRTLGGTDGIPELSADSFRLRTITSQIDIVGMDTVGRMREEAGSSDRDVSKGVKD